ncbi:MAG TPA: FtsH protease activity modulator HflK [Clostridiales bacterium]|nr:FtsH protease activity modulator HflK [Clostridiales bacterium]
MKVETVRLIRLVGAIVLIILLIALVRSSIFSVKESEQAVIATFGRYTRTVSAGLHGKLPWPFQSVTVLPANLTQKIELGYISDSSGNYFSIPEESMMITGDMNIVNIDFFVEWKISDPVKYLYTTENPTEILKNLLQSTVRTIVGTKNIDDVLTTGKIQIQSDVKDMLQARLNENDIGLMVIDVKVNDSEPPTEDVAKAFRDVETAKQEKETALNQALEYKNSKLPAANASADKIIRDAEAAKESKIKEATGQRDRFLAMFNEYLNFPAITRERMYLEALEEILPGITVYIDDGTGVEKLLPLEDLTPAEAAAAATGE